MPDRESQGVCNIHQCPTYACPADCPNKAGAKITPRGREDDTENNKNRLRIATDIAKVLMHKTDNEKRELKDIPPMPGATEVLSALTKKFGPENIFVISCVKNPKVKQNFEKWLNIHQILEKTGILPQNVKIFFRADEGGHEVATRADKIKMCKELGVNVMIDDSMEVIGAIEEEENFTGLAFRPDKNELAKPENSRLTTQKNITVVHGWKQTAFELGLDEDLF